MGRLFGTDGVRGVANVELTPELAYDLGRVGAYVLTADIDHVAKIVIGMDTRISSGMLADAIASGICSVGVNAVNLGVVPTPTVAHLIKHDNADAGIVVSASHNPFEFNGIKFFDNYGYKLPDAIEDRIEDIILENIEELPKPVGEKIGRKTYDFDAAEHYISFLKSTITDDLAGLKIALDCANGAAFEIAPRIFRELGAEVYVINNEPDGTNINSGCGSTHIDGLREFVKRYNIDIGIAFDGDADRALVVDENGSIVDGDQMMAIIGLDLSRKGMLSKNTIVCTVMSNLGFDIMAKKEGLNVVKTKVGDKYVLEEMLHNGYVLGGEQSGHIIFLNHNTTGDGLISALKICSIVKTSEKGLSELASVVQIFPQVLKNARVKNDNKYKYLEDSVIAKMCRELEEEFKGEGRVLIRPSGTEPLVRVMIEGRDQNYIIDKAVELAEIIEKRLG